jgi:hypothetical protein
MTSLAGYKVCRKSVEVGRRVEERVRNRKWNKFLKVNQFKRRDPNIKVPQRREQATSIPNAWKRGSVAKLSILFSLI